MTWLLFLSPDFFNTLSLVLSIITFPLLFPDSSATLFPFPTCLQVVRFVKVRFFFPFCISWWWMSHFPLPICIVFSLHSTVSPLDADKPHLFHQVFMWVCVESSIVNGAEKGPGRWVGDGRSSTQQCVCVADDVWWLQHSAPAGRSFFTFTTLTANWCNYSLIRFGKKYCTH